MAKRSTRSAGPHNILVWVGCPDVGAWASELAGEVARAHDALVTVGLSVSGPLQLERVVSPIVEQGVDVRVRGIGDRSVCTLVEVVSTEGFDLVLHADREAPDAADEGELSRRCPCPVWVLRGPSRPDQAA